MDYRSPRATALVALVITAIATLYAAGVALSGREPSFGWSIQAVIHVGELLAVVALARSAAAGPGRAAKVALATALLGQVFLAAAELIWPNSPGVGETLFAIGPLLTGLGIVAAGILVVRTRHWTGWRRWTPAAVGAYVFVALIPILVGTGGPPASAAVWAISGWDLLWSLVAVSALIEGARDRRPGSAHRPASPVTPVTTGI
ncbi:hypothetical protein ACWKSP_23260 [Micromonosporaceae bacterium Da 78-11]